MVLEGFAVFADLRMFKSVSTVLGMDESGKVWGSGGELCSRGRV